MGTIEKQLNKFAEGVKKNSQGFQSYCPFPGHRVKNSRSFHLNYEKGVVKCFSCGRGMSLFDFLLYIDVPFDIAVDYLFQEKAERKKTEELEEYTLGTRIPKSFIDKGFSIETLQHFGVGYDSFKSQTTTPIYFNNLLKGVGFRVYPKKMWYNQGFNMSDWVYNYSPTKDRFYVEGFSDTWRVWQNGTKNVSALFHNKAEGRQLELMRKHKNVYLALDLDGPGIEGVREIGNKLVRDTNVFVVMYKADLQDKNDPGNCSKIAWKKGLNNILTFLEFECLFLSL